MFAYSRTVYTMNGSEIAPVCAVIGGILGQEVIKVISQTDEPINNVFCFNGLEGGGVVNSIKI